MSLQKFNQFSYSSCSFSNGKKNENTYHFNMINNSQPVYVQLPKLKTNRGLHWHDNRCYLDLELTKPMLDFFLNFEKNNIQTVAKNSVEWFGKEMPHDIIESNYLSVIKLDTKGSYVRFSIPVNDDGQCGINVYNQFRERSNPEDIIPNTDVWVILQCKGLIIGKRNLSFDWSVEQIKFHTKQGNPYMFIDDDEVDVEILENPFSDEKHFEEYLQG